MAPRKSKAELVVSEAWKSFYNTPEGRVAVADLMVWCNVYSPIEDTDPIALAKATGERNVALRIARLIGLKPEAFPAASWEDADILDRMLRSKG